MKIIAFGASASRNSINKEFARFAASQVEEAEMELLDLNDYPLPLYTIDEENDHGIPDNVKQFYQKMLAADLLIISLAEHNGSYTVAFKNLFDWLSRLKRNMFEDKKVVLLSTAPGARGGKGVMDAAMDRFPIHGAHLLDQFILPHFHMNYRKGSGIIDDDLNTRFSNLLQTIKIEFSETDKQYY